MSRITHTHSRSGLQGTSKDAGEEIRILFQYKRRQIDSHGDRVVGLDSGERARFCTYCNRVYQRLNLEYVRETEGSRTTWAPEGLSRREEEGGTALWGDQGHSLEDAKI